MKYMRWSDLKPGDVLQLSDKYAKENKRMLDFFMVI